jgi:hypothetical protein
VVVNYCVRFHPCPLVARRETIATSEPVRLDNQSLTAIHPKRADLCNRTLVNNRSNKPNHQTRNRCSAVIMAAKRMTNLILRPNARRPSLKRA